MGAAPEANAGSSVQDGRGNTGSGMQLVDQGKQYNELRKQDDYVEWRRKLPWDKDTYQPSNDRTILRLMTRLGVYNSFSRVVYKLNGVVELSLHGSGYSGTWTFYENSRGKVTIGQTNTTLKEQIWWLLAPHTTECDEPPAKRRKVQHVARPEQSRKPPSPTELLQEGCIQPPF